MSVLNSILDIGRSGLIAQQKGISVAGHNIANVNTPGYSRQRLSLETKHPVSSSPGQLGTGVNAAAVQRVYDRFLNTQIQNETADLGRWEAGLTSLQKLEQVFNESSGGGLSQAMSAFWDAWQDLSNNPGGQVERMTLTAKGEDLATAFHRMRKDVVSVQNDADFSLCLSVDEVNHLSASIAGLNQKIRQLEVVGQNANDYRDQRDALVNTLSTFIDVNCHEDDDGRLSVMLGSGRPLVENDSAWRLSTRPDGNGFHDVVWLDRSGNAVEVTDAVTGGKFKGWLDVRDATAPAYLDTLDTLAGTLIAEVNALHAGGYGLTDPLTGLPYTGIDFFSGSTSADIAVSAVVSGDFRAVCASATQAGVPGDSDNAIRIANLQTRLTMNGTPATSTFGEFFSSMVAGLGNAVRGAESFHSHQADMVAHLNHYRESTSGVSLDEEMVDLVKFQHGYEASARLIRTVDEMMQTVLGMI